MQAVCLREPNCISALENLSNAYLIDMILWELCQEAAMSRDSILIDARTLNDRVQARDPRLVILAMGCGGEGIPTAVPVDLAAFAGPAGKLNGARPLPDLATLQAAARSWGIHSDSEVVFYDSDGNLSAARGWWTLKWAGVTSVRLLDGGLPAWEGGGYSFAALDPTPRDGTISLNGGRMPQVDAAAAADYAKNHMLLDARAYRAFQDGHIPGAVNLPASGNLDGNDLFLPEAALRKRYGIIGGRKVAVSCRSGVLATHTVAALATIDIEASLFVGSYSAWSADRTRPIVVGAL